MGAWKWYGTEPLAEEKDVNLGERNRTGKFAEKHDARSLGWN